MPTKYFGVSLFLSYLSFPNCSKNRFSLNRFILCFMITIFSSQGDFSTSIVIEWLRRLGKEWVRIDGDNTSIKFDSYSKNELLISINGKEQNLLNINSSWYRRKGLTKNLIRFPYPFEVNVFGNRDNYQNENLKSELTTLTEYLYKIIEEKADFNLGSSKNATLNKLIVLDKAENLGLKVPELKIFTSKNAVIAYLKSTKKKLISKAISDGIYYFTEKYGYYTYTERIDLKSVNILPETFFPSLLQTEINKKYELRVFYLSGEFYTMAIFSQSSSKTKVDFRKNFGDNLVRTVPYKLPENIETKLQYLFSDLELNTGSADLIVDSKGEYIFLEINPVGQFTMTSRPCNFHLEKRIAELL